MIYDLNLLIQKIGMSFIREFDGLEMFSRNQYLPKDSCKKQ